MATTSPPRNFERTVTQVDKCLEVARLSRDEMLPHSQSIFFDAEIDSEDLIMIEVDKHLLDSLKQGEVVIRGDPEDELVVCSQSKTYAVKGAGISNSLLVVPGLKLLKNTDSFDPKDKDNISVCRVTKTFHEYWEPRLIYPSSAKLYRLLLDSEYRGREYEKVLTAQTYSHEDLLNVIQASEDELKSLIESLPIVLIDNKYRMLEFDYQFRVLEYLLNSIENNSMEFDKLDVDTIISEVSELEPVEVAKAMVEMYAKDGVVNVASVSRTQAEVLLRNSTCFNLNDFMNAWEQSVPEGIDTKLEYLYGICYIDYDRQRPTINYLSKFDLPDAETKRFELLLSLKVSWSLDEITPYVKDFATKGVNALLLKYARAFRKDGQLLYSKK